MKRRHLRLSQAPEILPGHPEVASFVQAAGFHCRNALTILLSGPGAVERAVDKGVATALARVASVLERRVGAGMHEDVPAIARWDGGLSVTTTHPNGVQIQTNMPVEWGGDVNAVSPGWLMRAGLSACAATCIAMLATRQAVELTELDVQASSRSDARGIFGMTQADKERVSPGPCDMQLRVRISASNASSSQLRALVEEACTCSPVSTALIQTTPIQLHIEEGTA